MPHRKQEKETLPHLIRRIIFIALGATLASVAIELFLVPNNIIDGGIIGVGLILNILTNIPFGVLILVLNLPFLLAGYKHLGKNFFFSSGLVIVLLAVIEVKIATFDPITNEPLLATVFGGLLLGTGVGFVIRNGGALDGTEILGILLTRRMPLSVGEFVMFLNVFIFGWAGFVLGWEQAMYSILTYYIAAKAIDAVIQGLEDTKALLIVSDHADDIADAINEELGRSVTKLHGRGGYSDHELDVVFVGMTRLELSKAKEIILSIDPDAFTTVFDTQEAFGPTFTKPGHS